MGVANRQPTGCFLILGPAGSGMTTAREHFARYGFMSVADIRPENLAPLFEALSGHYERIVFSLTLRPDDEGRLDSIRQTIQQLKAAHDNLKVLCLDAPEHVLIQRYGDSGKPHPFAGVAGGLQAAVSEEKRLFAALKPLKDYSVDTSTTDPLELKNKIAKILGLPEEETGLTLYLTSFGFKYGLPMDAELVFDMRFIKNPFYVDELRPRTGQDKPVVDYIFDQAGVREFFDQWCRMLDTMLPRYQAEGKARLSIAIGCTGGKHRSVCMTEAVAAYLKRKHPTYNIVVGHREVFRWSDQDIRSVNIQPKSPSVGEAH